MKAKLNRKLLTTTRLQLQSVRNTSTSSDDKTLTVNNIDLCYKLSALVPINLLWIEMGNGPIPVGPYASVLSAWKRVFSHVPGFTLKVWYWEEIDQHLR